MKIAVCDDEKEIQKLFGEKIERLYPEAEVFLYGTGEELLMRGSEADIFLLDIQMPGKNGMETATELRRRNRKAIIIFVTALEGFVFQSFDVGAFHYLVKPFDNQKFVKVLMKAVEQFEERKELETFNKKKETSSFTITTGGTHIIVNPEEIVYAEVFDRKVIIHTLDSDIEYYGRMKELEKRVGEDFYRPHRAYLVNFNFIRKYDAAMIYLEKGQALMAKQNYREFVNRYLRYNQRKGNE